MLSRTHVLFASLILILIKIFFDIKITLILIILVFFASLLPDIDKKNSRLGKKMKFISLIFNHRGLLHTIWFAILFSIIIHEAIGKLEGIIFFIIYSSHIFIDGLTKKGVKPFYPLGIRMKGNVVVGGFKEKIIYYFLLLSLIFLLLFEFFNGILFLFNSF